MRTFSLVGSLGSLFKIWGLGSAPRLHPLAPRPVRWSRPHCGAQECARRRRQIERGTLTASNGLCLVR